MIKLSEIKNGDRLIADGGFTCLRESEVCDVYEDESGLYVCCAGPYEGTSTENELPTSGRRHRHHLDGQCDDGETVIGFERAP